MQDLTETISTTKKRRPIISIIISSDNDADILERCMTSLLDLKKDTRNVEFVIINNYIENENKANEIKYLVNRFNNSNLIYYQSHYRLTSAQQKNLGIDFSKGSWLYFIDYREIATPKFVAFLNTFKFNLQNGFYRVPILNEKRKKQRIGLIKTKYFSDLPSSIILNEEYMEKIKLRWESGLTNNETLLFLDKLYSSRNVNFVYLKKNYSVIHNFHNDYKESELNDIEEIKKTYKALINQHKRNYKQFIIVMLFNYFQRNKKAKDFKINKFPEIKLMLKSSKIGFKNYFPLGPKLYFKTLGFKWKCLF